MKLVKKMYWGIIIIVGCVFLDQITKIIAKNILRPKGSVNVIKGFFKFTYLENDGGAWGIFGGKLVFFILITVAALGLMIYLLKDFDLNNNKLYSIGLCLVIAGTIGNFIDRVLYKYVIDFFDFIFFGYDFPIFNVADICITFGVGLLIIKILFFHDASPEV